MDDQLALRALRALGWQDKLQVICSAVALSQPSAALTTSQVLAGAG
ncbi:MAG: hypothetical protein HKL82_06875 [Acidimicrobiaceae bacterium]|nr:hypothetical protein [Acidimicrobiaceae bacterium]